MTNSAQYQSCTSNLRSQPTAVALAMAIVFSLTVVVTQSAQAQTFTVLHAFSGGAGGNEPQAGVTMDAAGNLYGTTYIGGTDACPDGCGIVFKLGKKGSGWILTTLYTFLGSGTDGAYPGGRVAIAQDGTLYGTTEYGGGRGGCSQNGCGTVFRLTPPPTACKAALCPWSESVLYAFAGPPHNDGGAPQGDLTFDQSGNIYGTTGYGGADNYGVTYELTPAGGSWTETVLHSQSYSEGTYPQGGVIFDSSGNLYGVLHSGGQNGFGAVYELSPSGSNWTEQTLYSFVQFISGINPVGGLLIDPSGNLYGTTSTGGSNDGGGIVFEFTPASGGWTFNTIYNLSACGPCGPQDKLVMDAAGNLYGTTYGLGNEGYGSVFKLTPSNGNWTYTSLHDFTGGTDGAHPFGPILDANGNLYGTTASGGLANCDNGVGCGVVWEITP